ncbi:hypothetical protein [Yoonia sediminilitoris]|uniref:Uncharacterized protein n=1 Tax=Yoonia sediminilitoris TaxID=1286148 RepID=A0A2T6KPP1_9RHOB|nr:hypothetical protein [Yoonia sediminilitoris]PUB18529.1 hypothetical protein C8N45_101113 [Yoonia sediminilitoris]RCW98697.1 hypothetical protein DFP92_101113 [Yoonia sediminilitoris]
MARAIFTITFGSYLFSTAFTVVLTYLSLAPSNLTGLAGLFCASMFASFDYARKTGRSMHGNERITCALGTIALMLVIAVPALFMVFAVGGLLTNPKQWTEMLGVGMGDFAMFAAAGLALYAIACPILIYLGLGASKWTGFKPAKPMMSDA